MNKLIILLKQLNIIEDVNVLLHASLKKVIVHHDNHYTFYILSKDLIPFTEYQLLLDHGLDFPYLAEFVICYDDFNFESKDVSLYLGYIIEKLKQISPLFSSLKIEDIEIKQTISIGLLNEIQLEQFQQLKSTIKKYFVEIGIEKDFSFYVKQDNDELNNLLQEMDSYEPMKIDMSEIKKSEPVKSTVDYKNNYRKPKGDATFLKLSEINSQTMENNCTIQGYVFKTELIKTRAGKHIQTLWITDYTDSIMVKRFENNTTNTLEDIKVLDKGKVWIKATGEIRLDNYARETVMMARQIEVIKEPARRQDTVEVKRVELHTHSKMSAMDGIGNVSDYINQVAKWGHKAIAVTDHGNVQSFPEAQAASLKAGIKMIYGVELNMIEPYFNIVFNEKDMSIEDATYVSFDLETTGFSVIHDGITEFGAVKIKNGEVIDRLQSFVNPGKKIGTRVSQLTNITNEALKAGGIDMTLAATCNWYFLFVSTFLITIIGTFVTNRIVEKNLGEYHGTYKADETPITDLERKGLRNALIALLIYCAIMTALMFPANAPFRAFDESKNAMTLKYFLGHGLIPGMLLLFMIPGLAYGKTVGTIKTSHDLVDAMTKAMKGMGGYLVLAFFAAQFVSYFNKTNLGLILAKNGADFLESINLKGLPLLIMFILLSAFLNLFMGSASAKWAIMAPIFVPMMYNLGLSPALTQVAYRIGDSSTNIITPLMSYFAMIVVFMQKYDEDSGLGTLTSMMLPYSMFFLLGWTLLMIVWYLIGLPVGPEAPLHVEDMITMLFI